MDLKKQAIDLKKEMDSLIKEISICDEKARKYRIQQNNVTIDDRYVSFIQNYPKLSKVFNKKKYQEELKKLYDSIKAEYKELEEKESNLANNHKKRVNDISEEIEHISQELNRIDQVKELDDLLISFETAETILSQNNIDIFNYDYIDILKLGSSKKTSGNIEFMKKAIISDPFNIIYDQTNNYEMYYNFISNLDYDYQNDNNLFHGIKEYILDILTKSNEGSIRINVTYVLEAIRFYFKDVVIDSSGKLAKGDKKSLYMALSRVKDVCENAQRLSDDDYYKLEEMYNPQVNDYYCHMTSQNTTKENVESILTNGLRVSNEWGTGYYIGANARKVDCFLALAGYKNFYGGHGGGPYRIIMAIPKGTIRPIGGDDDKGYDLHILPEYIIACLCDNYTDNGYLTKSILDTSKRQKKVYRFLYENGYKPEQLAAYYGKTYLVMENPNYGFDESKEMSK